MPEPAASIPLQAFQRRRASRTGRAEPATAGEPATEAEQSIICGACGHRVTRTSERISRNGAHMHRRTNPHGIVFELGCFAAAPGCTQVGEPTEAHTWFPAHAWRVALCAGCGQHLGWGFHGRDGGRFYGLILERLASGP